MHVLLVDSDVERRDITTVSLEGRHNAVVTAVSDFAAARPLLEWQQGRSSDVEEAVDIVVTQAEAFTADFSEFLLHEDILVPVVYCSDDTPDKQSLSDRGVTDYASNASIDDDLKKIFDLLLSGVELEGQDKIYSPVRVEMLRKFSPLNVDVFVRLSSAKYVRLFNAGDIFEQADFEKYQKQRKISHLYVKRDDFEGLFISLENQLDDLLENGAAETEVRGFLMTTHETLSAMIDTIGFDEQTVKMARKTAEMTVKTLSNKPSLGDIIEKLSLQKDSYAVGHCFLLVELLNLMCLKIGWASTQNIEKLVMAALFHDITLRDDKLAAIQDMDELQQAGLSADQVETFENHPVMCSKFIARFGDIASEVETIIMQHHERPDGSGFPRGISADGFSPLSALFVICHDLALEMYHQGEDFDFRSFCEARMEYYAEGSFRSIMRGFGSEDGQ